MMGKKHRQFNKRKWLRIVVIACLVVAVPLTINATTYVPGAAVARFFVDRKGGAKPTAHYNSIKGDVTIAKDIVVPTDQAPTAKLDIYTPAPKGQSTATYPVILWIH